MTDNEWTDLFYFTDYCRLLIEENNRNRESSCNNQYHRVTEKIRLMSINIFNKGIYKGFYRELRDLLSKIKSIDNDTMIMRALLRLETEFEKLDRKSKVYISI